MRMLLRHPFHKIPFTGVLTQPAINVISLLFLGRQQLVSSLEPHFETIKWNRK